MHLLKFLAVALIVCLFVYSKLKAYEHQIDLKYQGVFKGIKSVLQPILNLLGQLFKPYRVGNGISLDVAQIILLILLLLIIRL